MNQHETMRVVDSRYFGQGRLAQVDDFNIEAMAAELATDNGDDYEQLSKAARMAVQVVARDYLAAALEGK